MKMTERKFAESILASLNQLDRDRYLSKRYIISIGKDIMKALLVQKLGDRTLYREANLYSNIDCIELEEIDVVKCPIVEFRTCNVVMRSKKPLPELLYSKYGPAIRMVTNIDTSEEIGRISLKDYVRNKKRQGYRKTPKYYTDSSGYLYVVDFEIELVSAEVMTLNSKQAEECGCGDFDECKSSLDYEMVGSHKLEMVVVQETLNRILGTYMQIPSDENPDKNRNSM